MDGLKYAAQVEKWDLFEIEIQGKAEGNPFTDYEIQGVFTGKNETVTVDGFYDGDGIYRVRFMPSFEGEYSFKVTGSFLKEEYEGGFTVTAPSKRPTMDQCGWQIPIILPMKMVLLIILLEPPVMCGTFSLMN